MDHRLPARPLFERRLRGQSPLELVDLPPPFFLLPECAHFLHFRERSGERGKLQRLEIIARGLRTAQQRREQGRGGAASRGRGPRIEIRASQRQKPSPGLPTLARSDQVPLGRKVMNQRSGLDQEAIRPGRKRRQIYQIDRAVRDHENPLGSS